MYREDLDQLVAMFRRSCQAVTISDDKLQYESLEEMKNQKSESKFTFLEIHGKDPGVQSSEPSNQTSMLKGAVPAVQTVSNELRTERNFWSLIGSQLLGRSSSFLR
jgi:hypothetical protein